MNILHIVNGWPLGGITNIVLDLIKNIKVNHYSLGYCWTDTNTYKEFEKYGCTNIVSHLYNLKNNDYLDIINIIKRYKIDIIHKHTGGGDFPLWVKEVKDKYPKIPLIETLYCPRISSISNDYVDKITCLFKWSKENSPQNVELISHSCDFPLAKPKKALWPEKRMIIGRIARYEPSKGAFVIVQLAHMIYNNVPQMRDKIKFEMYGNIFNEEYYNKIKEFEIENFLSINGEVENKFEIINRFDLCFNPSYHEFNYVFLESMSQGIPCIYLQDKYILENIIGMVIYNNDFNLSKLTKEQYVAIYQAIKYLYDNKDIYEKMSINCIEKFYNYNITSKEYSDRILKIYEESLNE